MSAAVDARGLKRVCVECGIRFYDMNKRPIICPGCSTEFTGIEKIKGRKPRAADPIVEEKKAEVETEEEAIVEDSPEVEEISLDDVAADEKAKEGDDEDEDGVDVDGDLVKNLDDLDSVEGDDLDEDDLEDLSISKKDGDE